MLPIILMYFFMYAYLLNFPYVRLFTPTYKLRLMDGIHLLGWNLERISFQKRKIVLDFDTPVLLGLSHLRDVHPSFWIPSFLRARVRFIEFFGFHLCNSSFSFQARLSRIGSSRDGSLRGVVNTKGWGEWSAKIRYNGEGSVYRWVRGLGSSSSIY